MDILIIIAWVVAYQLVGFLVGRGMWNRNFKGSRAAVYLVGGSFWPVTIWLLLIDVAFFANERDR